MYSESFWCALVATSLAISLYSSWLKIKKSSPKPPPLPPGPITLPFLGNLLSLKPPLHHHLAKLSQTYGPIFKLRMGTKLCIIISSPHLAKIILKDQDTIFSNHDVTSSALALTHGGIDIICSPNGPTWRKLRKVLVRKIMSNTCLDAFSKLRKREVRKMVKNIHDKVGSSVNVGEHMFITVLNVITSLFSSNSMLCGEDEGDTGAEFRVVVEEIVELFVKPNVSDFFPALARFDLQGIESKMKKLSSWFDRILESVVAERMMKLESGELPQDLLQFLLDNKDNHGNGDKNMGWSMEEIKVLFVDMIVAATDTTSVAVEWAMTEMLRDSDKMRRACEEVDEVVGKHNIVEEFHLPKLIYLNALIKETLRLHPPAPLLIPHKPSKTCCVAGYTIPEGSRIFVNAWAIQRDPDVWENAAIFEPERFLNETGNGDFYGKNFNYIPFGFGRRICPGIPLAEKMMMYVLATLLHSFDWKVSDDMELDMSEKFGVVSKKMIPLVVVASTRLPTLDQYI